MKKIITFLFILLLPVFIYSQIKTDSEFKSDDTFRIDTANFILNAKNDVHNEGYSFLLKEIAPIKLDTVKNVYIFILPNGDTETRKGFTEVELNTYPSFVLNQGNESYYIPLQVLDEKYKLVNYNNVLTYKNFDWK